MLDDEKEIIYLSKDLDNENNLLESKRKELESIEKSQKERESIILSAYEELVNQNKDLIDKSEELHSKMESTLKNEEFKIKKYNASYSMGKLFHNMYDDTKSVLKIGIFGILFLGIVFNGGDKLSEKDGVLKNLIDDDRMYVSEKSESYINENLIIHFDKLSDFNKDIDKVLENGYARESDDYLKSIYIKSKIVKEGKESLGESTESIDKLIKDLEYKLEIGD